MLIDMMIFVICHVAPRCHVTTFLVATQWLQDIYYGVDMMISVGHTK